MLILLLLSAFGFWVLWRLRGLQINSARETRDRALVLSLALCVAPQRMGCYLRSFEATNLIHKGKTRG